MQFSKVEKNTTSKEFPSYWTITNKYKYPLQKKMEVEQKTQEADKRKQTWKCCTDFFLRGRYACDHLPVSPKLMYLKAELSEAEADGKM